MSKKKTEILDRIRSNPGRIDAHTHVGLAYRSYLENAYPYGLSFEDLIIRMNYFKTDYALVFGIYSSFYSLKVGSDGVVQTNEDFSSFPYEVENRNLLSEIYDIFPEYSNRAVPFLLFDPSRKTVEQARHLDALCEKYPVFGLKTITTYIQAFVNDLETVGRPILEVIAKHQLAITFHCSWLEADPWANVFDIIKFAEKHPDLRICLAHTARFSREILERAQALPNCFVDLSAFDIHCQLAVKNSPSIAPAAKRFDADYTRPEKAMLKLAETYPDTILWGTDMPYNYFIQRVYHASGEVHETRLKSSFDREYEILAALPQEVIRQITYDNTMRYISPPS